MARQEYSPDGKKVTRTVLAAGHSGIPEGQCGTIDVVSRRVSYGKYHVGWTEPNGVIICNVRDLVEGTVSNFTSRPGPGGAPRGEMHFGTIRREPCACTGRR
jgi:hypothetical protein